MAISDIAGTLIADINKQRDKSQVFSCGVAATTPHERVALDGLSERTGG